MPINVNDPEYLKAEKEFHLADSLEKKLIAIQKMISHAPKHKGGENLRKQLTTKRKKLEQEIEKKKKSKKIKTKKIKKEELQVIIIGKTKSGKSSLLSILTNAKPIVSEIPFTTKEPIIGTMNYEDLKIQIIEVPSIESEFFDKNLVNNAEILLIIISNKEELKEIYQCLNNKTAKKIIVQNKIDLLYEKPNENDNLIYISCKTGEGIEKLKQKIFESFDKIRVYTKEPGKEKSEKPIILDKNSTIKDVAKKISKTLYEKVKEARIWGPSAKFPGQKASLNHQLKDKDIIEFKLN